MPYYALASVGYDYYDKTRERVGHVDVGATGVAPTHWTDNTTLPPTQYTYRPPMTQEDTMPVRLTQQQIDTLHDLAAQTGDRSALTVEHSKEHRNVVVAQVHGRTLLLDYEGSYIDAV